LNPKVAALLNITEDHLDRYDDFDHYVQSKGRLFQNQDKADVAVLNGRDPATARLEPFIASQKLYFNIDPARPLFRPDAWHGAMVTGGELVCRMPGKDPAVFNLSKLKLEGCHNLENAAAAALTALAAGGTRSGIQSALDMFEGLPHRLEHIRTLDGVSYYNDSKATNVDAVKRSLESFQRPVILIMGGRDKGGRYAFIEGLVRERVKALVVFGEAHEKILSALGGFTQTQRARSMEEAVGMAREQAAPGDVVLLSPGGSSFDMFKDYTERGGAFRIAVERLGEK
jgi:UDP-N-acetylmuramoylalanine--D-glutamate ligase